MIRKMKLDMDELAVETFETAVAGEEHGTVHGQATGLTCPFRETCNGVETCYDGCRTRTEAINTCPDPSSPVICQSQPEACPSYPEICP
ncbi:MAG TPA: hypothetical protein VFR81_23560 [Longimicrobium sp.]|nr:hypothetical protein [Longimicrobium sp.]